MPTHIQTHTHTHDERWWKNHVPFGTHAKVTRVYDKLRYVKCAAHDVFFRTYYVSSGFPVGYLLKPAISVRSL